jgi:hypothetical protein
VRCYAVDVQVQVQGQARVERAPAHGREDEMARRFAIVFGVALAASALLAASMALAAPSSEPGFSKKTAIEINVGGFATVDSADSTKEAHGARCGADVNGHVVWFTFTATSSEDLTADTVGSAYDTVLDVYERGKLLDCNDDFVGVQSRVGFQATAGRTYYFKVAAFDGGGGGNAVLNLNTN